MAAHPVSGQAAQQVLPGQWYVGRGCELVGVLLLDAVLGQQLVELDRGLVDVRRGVPVGCLHDGPVGAARPPPQPTQHDPEAHQTHHNRAERRPQEPPHTNTRATTTTTTTSAPPRTTALAQYIPANVNISQARPPDTSTNQAPHTPTTQTAAQPPPPPPPPHPRGRCKCFFPPTAGITDLRCITLLHAHRFVVIVKRDPRCNVSWWSAHA